MKQIANWALNVATMRGASYADARIVSQRTARSPPRTGRWAARPTPRSVGMSVRVLAEGAL